jgi:hypothetical protein
MVFFMTLVMSYGYVMNINVVCLCDEHKCHMDMSYGIMVMSYGYVVWNYGYVA